MKYGAKRSAAVIFSGLLCTAGWFGPSEKDIKVQLARATATAPNALGYCGVELCFTITNNADEYLIAVAFEVTGKVPGRSTTYPFRRGGSYDDGLFTDAIVAPHRAREECFMGSFSGSYGCVAMTEIEVRVTGAKFEKVKP